MPSYKSVVPASIIATKPVPTKQIPRLTSNHFFPGLTRATSAGTEYNSEVCTDVPGGACADASGILGAGPGEEYVHTLTAASMESAERYRPTITPGSTLLRRCISPTPPRTINYSNGEL